DDDAAQVRSGPYGRQVPLLGNELEAAGATARHGAGEHCQDRGPTEGRAHASATGRGVELCPFARPGVGSLAARGQRIPGAAEPARSWGAGLDLGAHEQPGVLVQSLIASEP